MAFMWGAVSVLALPPVGWVPVLLLAFPALLWLFEGAANRRQAFAVGWWWGFGHLVIGLYWITVALFTKISAFWWALPFSIAGLPALLAVFPGLAMLALFILRRTPRSLASVSAFAALWSLAEYARGHVLTGFPWNLTGYSWFGVLPVLQSAAWIGAYGLGLLTILVACLPVLWGPQRAQQRRMLAALALGLGMFGGIGGLGALRLAQDSGAMVPAIGLRLVQGDISQEEKGDEAARLDIVRRYLQLSVGKSNEAQKTIIIWPESAMPFLVDADPELRRALAGIIPPGGTLLTGAIRADLTVHDADGHLKQFWNSMLALNEQGSVVASYDKTHLVPFGEYMPFSRWLPLRGFAASAIDFSTGNGPISLHLPGLPVFSPLICYEVIFPGAVTDSHDRPQLMINITNDGWYGRSAGPYQHFAAAAVRAVEEGMPLIRAANTGISGVVDPYGRVIAELPLLTAGALDSPLPQALPKPTFYERAGDLIYATILIILFVFSILQEKPRNFKSSI